LEAAAKKEKLEMRPFVRRLLAAYTDAATSGAGLGMLVIVLLLSVWVLFVQDVVRAAIAGVVLYVFLVSSLAVGRLST
jgi:hypothetical protein